MGVQSMGLDMETILNGYYFCVAEVLLAYILSSDRKEMLKQYNQ